MVNSLQVMLYSGQLDIIVAAPLTEEMLWNLKWKYQDEYKSCKKQVWKVRSSDREVAGYVRHVRNFYQVSPAKKSYQCSMEYMGSFIWTETFWYVNVN